MTNLVLDDAVFLLGESAGRPAHVVALQLFDLPNDAPPDFLRQIYTELLDLEDAVKPVFRKHPRRKLTSPTGLQWADDGIDLDYHVRHSALPQPGRIRELLEAVSLQHGVNLDRRRPLWEFHLYEGLDDGRFATTFKTHHSLADGMSLAGHTLGGLSPDPASRDCRPPWAIRAGGAAAESAPDIAGPLLPDLRGPVRDGVLTALASASAAGTLAAMLRDTNAHVPFEAPRSIFNVSIGGARRFAGDNWQHARLKAIATTAGSSVNDVVLAVCGGALSSFLEELGALPDRSLIAMVPVSFRRDDNTGDGNAFGAILCDLRTTEADPVARLTSISAQMSAGKDRLAALSPREATALSRLIMGGAILNALGVGGAPRQPFNLIISNVPATPHPLYWNGIPMSDIYPISMISEGQAVNITVTRYADKITFGVVGDRKAVPHLQRMLVHLESAVADLEKRI